MKNTGLKIPGKDQIFVQFFFPKFKLANSGCGLSASAAYTPVFTVSILGIGLELACN